MLDFRKAGKTRLAVRIFVRFSQISQYLSVWVTVSKHGNPLGFS